ncbi:MAG: 23S rRNA (adenine(2503)-C(2))-methyltransferase RlmN [Sedimentisphaerales bacterium]|jgi:23S rRNA (adenine2503-C2)-methyltransferase|nr:23S rRNA (adenine(2503)-C(2))-methyltransferase RlmN [Sedimentisphaerales bacterium]NLT75935.1 23S rRNA (adenine(2503)-C(2))-methyltransferase RlmN [Planctomycetota bacterium]
MNKDLKDKTLDELERLVVELRQKKYVAKYLFSFLHTKNAAAVSDITPLSKAFRQTLGERGYFISQLKTLDCPADPDGSRKYLFELADGERVEAVLLRDGDRQTLCVSTQVGCAMGCAFCATARIGLRRNLTAGEITDQVNRAEADAGKIHNVVYMGMGEPFENYDAVLKSVRILNHASGKNIGIRHITISTCGIAPAIVRLADENVQPRLAISLNASSDTLRARMMPIARRYPLSELLEAVRAYQAKTKQRVTFEYVLIDRLNDSTAQARQLVKLLHGIPCNVNLIEHNPYSGCALTGSSRDRIARFASILKDAGVETVTRFKLGRRIKAACGQLQAGYGRS